jgi:hypothetical protein
LVVKLIASSFMAAKLRQRKAANRLKLHAKVLSGWLTVCMAAKQVRARCLLRPGPNLITRFFNALF